jgi:hypothetical protein
MRSATASQNQKIAVTAHDDPLLRPSKPHMFLVGGAAQTGFYSRGDINATAA